MPRSIEAVYEDGVLKPLEKLNIKEHTKLTIMLPNESERLVLKESSLEGIIDIAKDCTDSDLSTNHDRYLYGEVSG